MNKVNKILFLVAFLAFLASSFSFFFERNDFLGEMIDIKSVKSEIKNDPKFETSKFQTINSNRSKFRRMDLSSFLGDKNEIIEEFLNCFYTKEAIEELRIKYDKQMR